MAERKYVDIKDIEVVHVSSDESETCISYGRYDDVLNIFSSDNTAITKIKRAAAKNPKDWKCWEAYRTPDGILRGFFSEAPKRSLGFRSGKKIEVSEEKKQAARERFAGVTKYRKQKKVES